MTTQEKLLEAAEAALRGDAYLVLEKTGMKKEKETILREFSELPEFAYVTDRCLYLCLLAAAWEDL